MAITQEFANQLHVAALQGIMANPEAAKQGAHPKVAASIANEVAEAYIEKLGGIENPVQTTNTEPDEDTGYTMD